MAKYIMIFHQCDKNYARMMFNCRFMAVDKQTVYFGWSFSFYPNDWSKNYLLKKH